MSATFFCREVDNFLFFVERGTGFPWAFKVILKCFVLNFFNVILDLSLGLPPWLAAVLEMSFKDSWINCFQESWIRMISYFDQKAICSVKFNLYCMGMLFECQKLVQLWIFGFFGNIYFLITYSKIHMVFDFYCFCSEENYFCFAGV